MSGVCPIDGAPLHAATGNSKIAYCKKCQGCWVAGHALRGMVSGSHADAAERMRLFEARVALGKPADRACPEHPEKMSRFVYRAIDLDICPRCKGVWFDAGELKRLIAPTQGLARPAAAAAAGGAAGLALAGGKSTEKNESDSVLGDIAEVLVDAAMFIDLF
jgi:Zn-finger nucleic acid-binding protein